MAKLQKMTINAGTMMLDIIKFREALDYVRHAGVDIVLH